jgi:hypothetical protein
MALGAVAVLIDLLEAMHGAAAGAQDGPGGRAKPRRGGVGGRVLDGLGRVLHLVGGGVEALLGRFDALSREMPSSPEREAVVAVLNGILGDYLEAKGHPQAITMRLRRGGVPLQMTTAALEAAIPRQGSRLLVLAHGLCMNDLQWLRQGQDHGAALERDLGYTALYLHYNSGRHISTNGRDFAELLEALVGAWPVPVTELAIVGFSMGGLVARSAWHYGTEAGQAWPGRVDKLVFLATPHLGAPLARAGHWLDLALGARSYTQPLARLGMARSAGITDLRHSSLVDEDWLGRDRLAASAPLPRALPLPEGVACFTLAATAGKEEGDFKDRWIGDGLVPLASALGRHEDPARTLRFPEDHQWIGYQMHHLDLLCRADAYEKLRQWLA